MPDYDDQKYHRRGIGLRRYAALPRESEYICTDSVRPEPIKLSGTWVTVPAV